MIDPATLRSLIREVIAEEVKTFKSGQKTGAPPLAATPPIRIASDADLAAFARQVLHLAETPALREAILAGRHPFKLATGSDAPSGPGPESTGRAASHGHRLDKGVVTETTILKLPAGTSRLVLGPEVSITPLARDKAKSRNISIERARQ
ncbi:MAG: hypothetical protein E6Q98_21595 [Rhodospirillaceae bacterium]|nr:MAG: hypothetical protein E6Q98_21595 [Rhodospirillaceae bacterium]